MEVLLLVAERDGPEMLARIGMMRALNRPAATETGRGFSGRSVIKPAL